MIYKPTRKGLVPAGQKVERPRHMDPSRQWRSSYRWQKLRSQVLEEQPYCGICFTTEDLTVDHRLAVASGGDPYDRDNCWTLCRSHNSSKGAR